MDKYITTVSCAVIGTQGEAALRLSTVDSWLPIPPCIDGHQRGRITDRIEAKYATATSRTSDTAKIGTKGTTSLREHPVKVPASAKAADMRVKVHRNGWNGSTGDFNALRKDFHVFGRRYSLDSSSIAGCC